MNLIILSHMYPKSYEPYAGIFVQNQVEHLRKKVKGQITVVSPVPWSPKALWFRKKWRDYGRCERESFSNGIKVYFPRYLALPGEFFFPLQGYFMYLAIRFLIREIVGDDSKNTVLHAHAILPDGFAGVLLRKKYKLQVLCTLHGDDINSNPFITKLGFYLTRHALDKASKLVAVSKALARKAEQISQRKIDIVTNGVSLGENEQTRKVDGSYFGRKKIIFVGDLIEAKGIKELLNAFAVINTKHTNTQLLLVGNPILSSWIDFFLSTKKLTKSVSILGIVKHKNILRLISSADIFILPSYSEGMPTVMFEAMAAQTPMVISDVGGVSEVITDGENGLLIKPKSVNAIVEKVGLLLDNPSFGKMLAQHAYNDVKKKYTWGRIADLLMEQYYSLMNSSESTCAELRA